MPTDFQIENLELDLSVLQRLAESVAAQFPIFRNVEVQEYRGGLPTMTADGEHVLGPAPGISGLYVIGGCCVGGLSTAPALGELLAEWIVRGRPSIDLSFMAPDRLATGLPEDNCASAAGCNTRTTIGRRRRCRARSIKASNADYAAMWLRR